MVTRKWKRSEFNDILFSNIRYKSYVRIARKEICNLLPVEKNGYQHSIAHKKTKFIQLNINEKIRITVCLALPRDQYLNCTLEALLSTSQCLGLAGNTVESLHSSELVISVAGSIFFLTQGAV